MFSVSKINLIKVWILTLLKKRLVTQEYETTKSTLILQKLRFKRIPQPKFEANRSRGSRVIYKGKKHFFYSLLRFDQHDSLLIYPLAQ